MQNVTVSSDTFERREVMDSEDAALLLVCAIAVALMLFGVI